MKPHFHKVPIKPESTFSLRHDIKSNLGTIWHYHPELELHSIIKGEGVQFIGDHISNFNSGDMVFLGENLPHTWRCREEYFVDDSQLYVEVYVLHINPNCLGHSFLSLPESNEMIKLFEKAKQGLKIQGKTKEKISNLLEEIIVAKDLDKIILLLSVIQVLCKSNEYEIITPTYAYKNFNNHGEMAKLEKIYTYVLDHYKEDITLEDISTYANMSVTSFCRYFKTRTNKTFSEFLNEIRISNVCRLLIADMFTIDTICLNCGFNNISNFYRQFKKVTGMTPFEYKKKFLG